MLCDLCKNLSVARGIRECECLACKKITITNINFIDMCNSCSETLRFCQKCGATINRLNPLENDILKEIDRNGVYHFIARDHDGDLYLYENEPYLDDPDNWDGAKVFTTTGDCINFRIFDYLFQTIQFDNSPQLIADLIQ